MEFIDKLNNKNYIKNLDECNAEFLASNIREFLIEKVTDNGGHLASNLGVVELTLALHKVFNFPYDKIVFDVGHQSYVHKLLSGRIEKFDTLRKLGGMSGFPKTSESEYDCFNTGHSSTSVSAAYGIAKARDLKNDNYNVIAFIGDGALGGGMAFEALNNVGISNTKIIIVLNDNEMSINKNVGGLSAYLSMLRLDKKYLNAKNKMQKFLGNIGSFGNVVYKIMHKTKKVIKSAAIETSIFENLGFKYIGIIDGHDFSELTEAFETAKAINGPVIIHTFTQKGRGYKPAENNPDLYHGIKPKSGQENQVSDSYTDVFGECIVKKAKENERIVAITAAMCSGCGLTKFSQMFPERFYDVGIAEQHAVTFAAGLASGDVKPVVCIYSTFLQRAYDQILHDVCMQNLDVLFAVDRAGIVGEDGETHQGVFDLSYLLHIPQMTVLAPSCRKELVQMMDYILDNKTGPVAIRYPKSNAQTRECSDFVFAMPEYVSSDGFDVVLIAIGRTVDMCVQAQKILSESGIKSTVVNLRTLKPLNKEEIEKLISKSKITVSVEDNVISGGCGSFILSAIECSLKSKFVCIGYDDCYIQQGNQDELFDIHGLTPIKIVKRIEKELAEFGRQS